MAPMGQEVRKMSSATRFFSSVRGTLPRSAVIYPMDKIGGCEILDKKSGGTNY